MADLNTVVEVAAEGTEKIIYVTEPPESGSVSERGGLRNSEVSSTKETNVKLEKNENADMDNPGDFHGNASSEAAPETLKAEKCREFSGKNESNNTVSGTKGVGISMEEVPQIEEYNKLEGEVVKNLTSAFDEKALEKDVSNFETASTFEIATEEISSQSKSADCFKCGKETSKVEAKNTSFTTNEESESRIISNPNEEAQDCTYKTDIVSNLIDEVETDSSSFIPIIKSVKGDESPSYSKYAKDFSAACIARKNRETNVTFGKNDTIFEGNLTAKTAEPMEDDSEKRLVPSLDFIKNLKCTRIDTSENTDSLSKSSGDFDIKEVTKGVSRAQVISNTFDRIHGKKILCTSSTCVRNDEDQINKEDFVETLNKFGVKIPSREPLAIVMDCNEGKVLLEKSKTDIDEKNQICSPDSSSSSNPVVESKVVNQSNFSKSIPSKTIESDLASAGFSHLGHSSSRGMSPSPGTTENYLGEREPFKNNSDIAVDSPVTATSEDQKILPEESIVVFSSSLKDTKHESKDSTSRSSESFNSNIERNTFDASSAFKKTQDDFSENVLVHVGSPTPSNSVKNEEIHKLPLDNLDSIETNNRISAKVSSDLGAVAGNEKIAIKLDETKDLSEDSNNSVKCVRAAKECTKVSDFSIEPASSSISGEDNCVPLVGEGNFLPVEKVGKTDFPAIQKEETLKVEIHESLEEHVRLVYSNNNESQNGNIRNSLSGAEETSNVVEEEDTGEEQNLESVLKFKSPSSANNTISKTIAPSLRDKNAVGVSEGSHVDQIESCDSTKKFPASLDESEKNSEVFRGCEEQADTAEPKKESVTLAESEPSTESLQRQKDIQVDSVFGLSTNAVANSPPRERFISVSSVSEVKEANSDDSVRQNSSVSSNQDGKGEIVPLERKKDNVPRVITKKPSEPPPPGKKSQELSAEKLKPLQGGSDSLNLEKSNQKMFSKNSHASEKPTLEAQSKGLFTNSQDGAKCDSFLKHAENSDVENAVKVIREIHFPLDNKQEMMVEKKTHSTPLEASGKALSKSDTVPEKSVSISKDKNLLGITAECRVELEITKIPASHQTKLKIPASSSKSNIVVLKKDPTVSSTHLLKDNEVKKCISLLSSGLSQPSNLKLIRRPPKSLPRPDGMVRIGKDDSMLNHPRSSIEIKRPGRKRTITIDSANRPISPAVKVVRMDLNNLKSGGSMVQLSNTKAPPRLVKSAPVKTSSALEMLLMNRGGSSSVSDASVANFCQVEQIVTEPDISSTPMKQLKKLSKSSADSILKQIANGGQRFGAITISPVKPSPSPLSGKSSLLSIPMKLTPQYRPAGITRSSSVDDTIEGVVAGQGEINEQCLLGKVGQSGFTSKVGEIKKKRGRPRKLAPQVPAQQAVKEHFVHKVPEPLFVIHGPRSTPVKSHLPALKPIQMLTQKPAAAPSSISLLIPEVKITKEKGDEKEEEATESQKIASGRSVRACRTVKEPKKKGADKTEKLDKPKAIFKVGLLKKKNEDKGESGKPDLDEEVSKQKAIEEEAKRKQDQREKRSQERARKLEIRSKALAEKKLKLKRRAEERKRQYYEKKQRLQEEKAEMERRRALAPPDNFEEETQMGDELDESVNSDTSRNKKGRMEVIDPESSKEFKVQHVAEYQWPLQGGEFFMLQEQISHYLGVKSFKRKYPDIKRRPIEAEERTFLCDSGLVSETMCDLGLTALRSADVLDIMFADFHGKYEEFRQYLRDRQAKEFSLKQLALAGKPTTDQLGSIERAVQSAARWNSALNKSRQESRRCSLDLQTFVLQYPRNRFCKVTKENTTIGNYPVSLMPGQFSDHFKQYSSAELRYFPINSVLYGPIKPYKVIIRESRNDYFSDSDDSSSSDGSSGTSSNGSGSENSADETSMAVDPHGRGQEGVVCKVCNGNRKKNKNNKPEVLIHCAQCTSSCHPTCLDLSVSMVPYIQKYNWQCTDCKKCGRCKEAGDEEKMLFCDLCDRGHHIYCVGLKAVPEGRWHCQECAVCCACSAKEPGSTENSLWHHEYKKSVQGGENIYLRSFCESCAKMHDPGEFNILRREN